MMISVAMCTYNGAQFIEEQLLSILSQTMPVGEIVVCDDNSSDETILIVEQIATKTTIPIRIYVNESNIGFIKNFDKAIKLCNGELIFLSDQDDRWMPNKTEVLYQWFLDNPQKEVVFTDAILMDEIGRVIMKSKIPDAPLTKVKSIDEPLTLWESVGFSKLSQRQFDMGIGFELWLKQNRATGAAMALRKSFIEGIKMDYDCDNLCHDFVISIVSLMKGSLGYLIEPLIYYRIHTGQTIGCSLVFPKYTGYDDARYWEGCCDGIELLPIDYHYSKRIIFARKRGAFKHSFFACKVILNTHNYIKLYRNNWWYLLSYDFMISLKHTYSRIQKIIVTFFSSL